MSARGLPVVYGRAAAKLLSLALAVSLLAPGATVWGDEPTPEADFKAANERMLSGDVPGAIALYQHLESRGVAAADLSYNLGVALAKADRQLDAIMAWERALRLDPSHADARANLAAVRARLPVRAAPTDEATASVVEALEPVVAPVPRDAAAFALALAVAALCALAAVRRLGLLRGRGTGTAMVLAAVVLVLSGAVVGAQEAVARDGRAVVRTSGQLKDGAEDRFADVAAISAGERVRVVASQAGWVQVEAPDGVSGWLRESAVQRL